MPLNQHCFRLQKYKHADRLVGISAHRIGDGCGITCGLICSGKCTCGEIMNFIRVFEFLKLIQIYSADI